ncbi:uncharacterized protein LOC134601516 [Pelobates fuscus]|uniref:uncharacterized protein LOC134601516 n=1 Tax=Pelobates fuscus TaxID=191477 RepID=UPI002FE43BDF
MKIILALYFCTQGIWKVFSEDHCVYQLETIRVSEGGSVTIPCTYSSSKYEYESVKYSFSWGESSNTDCSNHKTIYIANETFTHKKYQGRLFRNSDGNSESLTIHGLRRTDGPVICCLIIQTRVRHAPYTWRNLYGTSLLFTDELWVDQLHAIPAILGENITIPCYIRYTPWTRMHVHQVIWRKAANCFALNHTDIDTRNILESTNQQFPLVNYASDLSLRIHNIQKEDEDFYCCIARTRQGTVSMKQGTELVIKDNVSTPGLKVTQPEYSMIHKGGSATINCSFNIPQDRHLLYFRVYWRVDSLQGMYAIHPSEDMIDPRYRGRTTLNGKVDLHISNVQSEDSTLYYCIVMLTLCAKPYIYKSVIEHGQGTRLTVSDLSYNLSESQPEMNSVQTLHIILTIRFIVFGIIIVCGIVGYRHVRKLITS